MGEEVAEYNGAYKASKGMLDEFGPNVRIGYTHFRIGFCWHRCWSRNEWPSSDRRVYDLQFFHGSHRPDCEQCGQDVSDERWTIQCTHGLPRPTASAGQLAATHSQAFESWYANCPGLKVVVLADPYDAKGLLKSAIRDDDPVLIMESEQMYGDKGKYPNKSICCLSVKQL